MFSRLRAAIWPLAAALACAPIVAYGQAKPVASPSAYVPQSAISYGSPGQPATAVTPATPLPTICVSGCSATGAGTATAEPPTLEEGQAAGLNFDLNNGLRISGGGGGGSGGPTTLADGADVTQGAKGDAAWSGTGSGSITAILKAIRLGQSAAQPVSGTFWQDTQPVSAASLPLPSGAATAAAQTTGNGSLSSIDGKLTGVATAAAQATGNGALASIDGKLTGAATAANQAAVQETVGSKVVNRAAIYDAAGAPVDWTAPVATNLAATTTGGCTPYGYQSAATTNATLVATGARTLCGLTLINTTSSIYYLRLYNTAAAPTCSSATGFVYTLPIPAATTGAGVAPSLGPFGQAFGTGLGFCLTGGPTSTDNAAAAAGVFVIAGYK